MTYDEELAGLPAAYEAAAAMDGDALQRAAHQVRGRAVVAVGSGGAFPAARLAARLHIARTGRPAVALTPLAYAGSPAAAGPTCLLLASATGRHPDTAVAATVAAGRGHSVLLVTQRRPDELDGPLAEPSVAVLTVPQPSGRDGFLATGSVLATATALVRLYAPPGGGPLPAVLPALQEPPGPHALRERVLVLHGPDEQPAADDVEARLSESGLAAVQVADYRTLAHGRHFGLARHLDRTTVVALAGPGSADLADRTLRILPATAHVVSVRTPLEGPAGALDLLVRCAWLPTGAAREQGVSLHRPGVPPFGRRLYHLSYRPDRPPASSWPVRRKIDAAGLDAGHPEASEWYGAAFARWIRGLRAARIGALVLDYDGTVVTTEGRFELPALRIQQALLRLLGSGLPLAFASGRGDSLHRDLRAWVPREHWGAVHLGLHNGTWMLRLCDEANDEPAGGAPVLAEVERRLGDHPPGVLAVRRTASQVSVTSPDALVGPDTIRTLVEAALRAVPRLDVRVAGSAHSVDVTAAGAGKEHVVRLMEESHGAVLAAGDRGDAGGNDFDLLAATPWSFSVDRCSADPGRCWPVEGGVAGPPALMRVLDAIQPGPGGHRFRPPAGPRRASGAAIR